VIAPGSVPAGDTLDQPATAAGGKAVLVHNTSLYLNLHYAELIESLLARGWRVSCVAPRDDATAALEALGAQCTDISLSRRGMNPFKELGGLRALYRVFRRERPDVVLNFSIKPAI
jgi:hypothetical protein